MNDVFISHCSADDAFVRELQLALGDYGVSAWIDSRELLPGGLLELTLAHDIRRVDEVQFVLNAVSRFPLARPQSSVIH